MYIYIYIHTYIYTHTHLPTYILDCQSGTHIMI